MRKIMKSFLVTAFLLFLFVCLYYFNPGRGGFEQKVVTVISPKRMAISDTLNLKGTVVEDLRRDIALSRAAKVVSLGVVPGDYVEAGQVLATLEYFEDEGIAVGGFSSALFQSATDLDISRILEGEGSEKSTQRLVNGSEIEVLSPINGVIMGVNCAKGESVYPYNTIISVSDLYRLSLKLDVSEDYIGKISPGQPVKITLPSDKNAEYFGTVKAVAPYAHRVLSLSGRPVEHKTTVIVGLENAEDYLKPGYTATAQITVEEYKSAITLPYSAVEQDKDGEYVLVLSGNNFYKKHIVTGLETADCVQIISGLDGTEVVAENASLVPENAVKGG